MHPSTAQLADRSHRVQSQIDSALLTKLERSGVAASFAASRLCGFLDVVLKWGHWPVVLSRSKTTKLPVAVLSPLL